MVASWYICYCITSIPCTCVYQELTSDIGIYRRGKKSFSLERHSGAKKYMIALWHGFGGYQYYGLEDSSSHTFTFTPGFAFVATD